MGVTEEAGKVAGGVVSGLTSQPLALALIVVNVLFLAMFVWIGTEVSTTNRIERTSHAEMFTALEKTCAVLRDKLSNSQYRLQSDDPPPEDK